MRLHKTIIMEQDAGASDSRLPRDRTMKSLTICLAEAIADGYVENFTVIRKALATQTNREKRYEPNDVRIVNFYRFEDESNPDDTAIMYSMETVDGIKGTLVDAYGVYADANITEFVLRVMDIHKENYNADIP